MTPLKPTETDTQEQVDPVAESLEHAGAVKLLPSIKRAAPTGRRAPSRKSASQIEGAVSVMPPGGLAISKEALSFRKPAAAKIEEKSGNKLIQLKVKISITCN